MYSRLWPKVWKGVGLLLLVLVLASVIIGKRWQSQRDRLRLLSPSEWSFCTGSMDCLHGGGSVYRYGFIERIPRSTLSACGG